MANDLWRTPPEVMLYLEKQERFIPTIDACADEFNKKCDVFFSEENSFLDADPKSITGQKIWCNPPYSKPLPFVKQCFELSQNNNEVFMLLNMDTSTKWFIEIEQHSNALIMPVVGGRIAFVGEDGKPKKENNKPQVFIKFHAEQDEAIGAKYESVYHKEIMEYKEG